MNVKRILASVLAAVFVFNTVAEPLTSMAKEPETESVKPEAEFQNLIYDDKATFDQYAEVLMGKDGFYAAYAGVTIPERAQFLEKLSDDEMYQLKLFAKYGIVDDLIALGEKPTVDDLEPVFAHAELYAEISNPEVKDKKALNKKACEWMAKSYQKEYHDFDSYHEFLQSMAEFDVKELLEWVDLFADIDQEHLANTVIEFRHYVYAIYGFDEEDTGVFGVGGDGDTSDSIESIVSDEEMKKIKAEKKEKAAEAEAAEDEIATAAESRAINKVIFGNTPILPVDNYFGPRFIPNVTKESICSAPSGAYWDKTSSGTYELVESGNHQMSYAVKDSDKGKIWIKYSNVGTFNGEILDMKITAVDWKNPRRMQFGWNKIGAGNSTFTEGNKNQYIRFRVEYFRHGTSTLVSGLKGHQTLDDMDWIDGPEYWGGGTNCSSTVYMSSTDSQVLTIDGNLVTLNKKHGGTGMSDGADFIYLFNGPSHEFNWYGGFCGLSSASCPAQEFLIKYVPNGGQGYMEPTRVKVNVPTVTRQSTFTRSGYRQNGWKVFRDYDSKWATMNSAKWTGNSINEANRIYSNGCTVSNEAPCGIVYFYANWEKIEEPAKEHYVAFDTQGGHIKPGIIRNGKYRLQYSGDSSKGIHLKDGNSADGTEMVIWTGTGSSQNTDWYFERYKDTDYYYIMNAHRTKYIKTSGTYNGAPTLQQKPNNTNNDPYLWEVVPEGSSYSFVNKQSGYALDLPNGNTENGQRIQEHTVNHSTAEKWNLLTTDTTKDYPTKKKVQNCYFWITDSVPVKNGYEFVEWNTNPNGYGTSYAPGSGYTPDQNGGTVTLYAIWEGGGSPEPSGTYQVEYDSNCFDAWGSMSNSTHTIGVAKNLSRNQYTRNGYRFVGWNTYPSGNGKSYSDGQSVINLSTTPGDVVTLYAQWEADSGPEPSGTYQVQYDSNSYDAWGYMANSTHTIGVSKTLSRNQYTRDGYRFTGWNTDPYGYGNSYSDGQSVINLTTIPGATVTLYAQWEADSGPEPSGTYQVQYDSNSYDAWGSMANSTHTIGVAKNLSRNQYYRDGYRFVGWNTYPSGLGKSYSDGQSVINLSTTPGDVVILYAQWEEENPEPSGTYQVRYVANGGSGTMANSTHTIGVAKNLSRNQFYRSGYKFVGWNTHSGGYGDSYSDGESVINLTTTPGATVYLYAQWEQESEPEPSGTYQVEYDSNSYDAWGSMANSIHTIGVAKNLSRNQYYREGYKFVGWNTNAYGYGKSYSDGQSVINLATTPGATVTLYAQWEAETGPEPSGTYTVRYDKNGGLGYMNDTIFNIGAGNYLDPNQFYRTGYVFTGWNTDPYGYGDSYFDEEFVRDLSTIPGSVVTLYAQWERETPSGTYTVRYNSNGGWGTMNDSIHTIGVGRNLNPNKFYRPDYRFVGWNTRADGYGNSYEDEEFVTDLSTTNGAVVTLYAQWEEIVQTGTYTVIYDANGGQGYTPSSTHTIGIWDYLNKNEFYRDGYTFTGWNTSPYGYGDSYRDQEYVVDLSTTPGATVRLYAQWEFSSQPTYTVKYDANGGDGIQMKDSIMQVDAYEKLTKNQYFRDGYQFIGWNTSKNGGGISYDDEEYVMNLTNPGGVITLYAQWREENPEPSGTYQVRYVANGGSGTMSNSTHTIGVAKNLNRNQFYRDGYEFVGWNTHSGGYGDSYSDGESVINLTTTPGATVYLYAQWKEKPVETYYVRYDPNGGNGSTWSELAAIGETYTISPNEFNRNGYTFTGWNTRKDGMGTDYREGQIVEKGLTTVANSTVTLYAQWEQEAPKTYTVTYDANGGTGYTPDSIHTIGQWRYLSENGYTRNGYTFKGWNTERNGSGTTYRDREYVGYLSIIPGDVVTLYAQWEKIDDWTYTVIYDANEGQGTMSNSIHTVGVGKNLNKNQYYRNGYVFTGWNTNKYGAGRAFKDEEFVLDLCKEDGASITLYAQWEEKPAEYYYVNYNPNGGSGSTWTDQAVIGEPYEILENASIREGYTFTGWNTSRDGKGTSYRVGQIVEKGLTTVANSTVTLYAQWEQNLPDYYTVKYDANGGTGQMNDSKMYVDTYYKLSKNQFTREGYTFIGWNRKTDGNGMSYYDEEYVMNLTGPGETVTLYAQWKENEKYGIYFEKEPSVEWDDDVPEWVASAVIATINPKDEIVEYSKWIDTNPNNTEPTTWDSVEEDYGGKAEILSLIQTSEAKPYDQYAHFAGKTEHGESIWGVVKIPAKKLTYTVKYDGNGSTSGTTPDSIHTIGEGKNLTKNGYVKEKHKFVGWNTQPDGSGTSYKDQEFVTDLTTTHNAVITLYAQWETEDPKTYTVIYNANGGDGIQMKDSVMKVDVYEKLTKNQYMRDRYQFIGWNTSKDGNGISYSDEEYVKNIANPGATVTLYAQWREEANYGIYFQKGPNATWSDDVQVWDAQAILRTINSDDYIVEYAKWYDTNPNNTEPTSWNSVEQDYGYNDVVSLQLILNPKAQSYDQYAHFAGKTEHGESIWGVVKIPARKLTYTVKYNGNGATGGSTADSIHTIGEGKNLTKNGYEREDYTFIGWNTQPDGSGASYSDQQFVTDLTTTPNKVVTLYAQWKSNGGEINTDIGIYVDGQNGSDSDDGTTPETSLKTIKQAYKNAKATGGTIFIVDTVEIEDKEVTLTKTSYTEDGEVINLDSGKEVMIKRYSQPVKVTDGFNVKSNKNTLIYLDVNKKGTSFVLKNITIDGHKDDVTESSNPNMIAKGVTSYGSLITAGTKRNDTNITIGTGGKLINNHAIYKDSIFDDSNIMQSPAGAIQSYGKLLIEGGEISNNISQFGTVLSWGESTVMKDGKIVNNMTYTTNSIPDDEKVYTSGGVSSLMGEFLMKGGEISNNRTNFLGGGINSNGSTLVISGGTISDNTASVGGGIFNAGTLTLEGGEISGNVAEGNGDIILGDSEENSLRSAQGGGIYNFLIFNMSDGKISNNNAKNGGGLFNDSFHEYAYSYVSGGEISGNKATEHGDGVYQHGTFKMEGAARIDENNDVYLEKDKVITISGKLTSPSGVIARVTPSEYMLGRKIANVEYGEKLGSSELEYADKSPKFILTDDEQYVIRPVDYWITKLDGFSDSELVLSRRGTLSYESDRVGTENMPTAQEGYANESMLVSDKIPTAKDASFINWKVSRLDGVPFDGEAFFNPSDQVGQLFLEYESVVLKANWEESTANPPTITVPEPSKTFYEGTKVTREDLLEGITAEDGEGVDITKDIQITKIEYAAGRLINEEHQEAYVEEWKGGMPETAVLDTWFMELDKELSPVEHKVTFEVTNAAGMKTTATQTVYVKYNEFPVIQADDRYFTLEEAQAGKITDKVLREEAIEEGKLSAEDAEEGDFSNTSKITLLDFDAEEFKNFTEAGYRKLTFHVQDTYGPEGKGKETLCQITVYIMEAGEVPEPEKAKVVRFIDEKYYNLNKDCDPENMTEAEKEAANGNGGLNVNSKWYRDEEYRTLIEGTFRKTSGTHYRYSLDDLNAMRAFVDEHGPGNAAEPDALAKFVERFMTGDYLIN